MTADAYTEIVSILMKHLPNTEREALSDRLQPLAELELDSLSILEVIYELEDYFGFELSQSQIGKLTTLDDLIHAFEGSTKPTN